MSMTLNLKKAVREQLKLRVALIGPSGSGKTYSALRLAMGMQLKTEKPTLLLDCENGRGKIYANEFDYCYEQFVEPFSPERYIEYIKAAEDAGVGQLIIDGCSPEWKYLLAQLSVVKATSNNKNEWGAWDKITPRHDAFVHAIIYSKIHLILLMRGKDEYKLEDKNGKQVPKKLGVGPIMRDGLEYECNVAFTIDLEGHLAVQTKDDTHRFEDQIRTLTEDDGAFLIEWAERGVESTQRATVTSAPKPAVQSSAPTVSTAPKKTAAQIDAEIRSATSLDLLVTIWQGNQNAMKLLSDEDTENLLITKNVMKNKLSERPADPQPAVQSSAPAQSPAPSEPPPMTEHQAEVAKAIDANFPARDGHAPLFDAKGSLGVVGVTETQTLRQLIRSAKKRTALEGVNELVTEYAKEGRITTAQRQELVALVDEKEAEISAGKGTRQKSVAA